jgi:hypothetical protein
MRVLIACEVYGAVRESFRTRGHDAWSCDVNPAVGEGFSQHYECDVLDLLHEGWDLMIAHPPCTHLAVSGARWFKDRRSEQHEAVAFFMALANAPIPRIAVENPIGVMSTYHRKPDQIIQPWQFWAGEPGLGEVKATCLWLKGLPKLVPTTPNEPGRVARVWRMGPSPTRSMDRSRTYQGIAAAMADQWGNL